MVIENFRQKFITTKIATAVKRDRYVPDRSIVPLTWKTGENYFLECAKSYRFRPDPKTGGRFFVLQSPITVSTINFYQDDFYTRGNKKNK